MARNLTGRVAFLFASLTGLVGCVVPTNRYDEAQSALAAERGLHRQTHSRAYDLERQLLMSRSELERRAEDVAERDRLLLEHGKLLAQAELDLAVAAEEHDGATEVALQLRTELERVGKHLREFALQKDELQQALDAAETRAASLADAEREAARRASLMRDLALALHGSVESGAVALRVDEGTPTVRMPVDRAYADGTGDLAPDARRVVQAVAEAAIAARGTRVELRETDAPNAAGAPSDLLKRLERLSDALAEAGVPLGNIVLMPIPAPADTGTLPVDPGAPGAQPADEHRYLEIALVTTAS